MILFKRIALVCLVGLIFCSPGKAQNRNLADILFDIESESNPHVKAILLEQASILSSENPQQALDYLLQATDFATQDSLLARLWDQAGRLQFSLNDFSGAERSFDNSRHHLELHGDPSAAARANNRVGVAQLRLKRHEEALETLLESASFFQSANDELNLAICYTNIAGVFADLLDYENAITYNEQALEIFQRSGVREYELITLTGLAGQYLRTHDLERAISYNLDAERLGEELNDAYSLGIVYNNLGQLYFEQNELPRALEYYLKSLEQKQTTGSASNLAPTLINLGQIHIRLGQPADAMTYLTEGLSVAAGPEELWQLHSNLTKAHIALGNSDEAAYSLDQTVAYLDSAFAIERQQAIDELQTRYETERIALEVQELENRHRQSQQLFYGLAGLFAASLFITFLTVKNNRKKRIIAEQNEQIEKQRFQQLLSEQEIISADAMLKGQNSARKRIAEDLHDSIGSSLATLGLYIESLGNDDENPVSDYARIHKKAERLLDETYQSVRKIAHDLNAETLKQGELSSAIRALTDNITGAQKLAIEVIETGPTTELPDELKICTLRTVQELLSNTVRHAGADNVIVQITHHDDQLNIIVEDDGAGFDPAISRKGLGLTSIRNRTLEFNGELTIDSSPGNGTTVILNLPL